MIRLYTASPGSGKTCLVMEHLIKVVDSRFYDEIYTNIAEIKIMGLKPLPPDADWRLTNPNKENKKILIVIDEAQYYDAFMKENRSVKNDIGKDLSTHRHYGIDLWLISQSTKLLNDYVLENVGEHVHLYRPRKKKTVTVYWWSFVQRSLSKTAFKDADDMQKWRLNPAMFDLYKSTASVTDGKARTSQKVVSTLFVGVGVMILLAIFVNQGVGAFKKMKDGETQTIATVNPAKIVPTAPPASVPASTPAPIAVASVPASTPAPVYVDSRYNSPPPPVDYEAQRVASVISFGNRCTLYNSKGVVLDLPKSDCLAYASGEKRMSFAVRPSSDPTYTAQSVAVASTPAPL